MDKLKNSLIELSAFDYENIDSIRSNLSNAVGYIPTDKEISDALVELNKKGCINFYKYNQTRQQFELVPENKSYTNELWFMS